MGGRSYLTGGVLGMGCECVEYFFLNIWWFYVGIRM